MKPADTYERSFESPSMRCLMPTFTAPVIPFGTPASALAVGIPFADAVVEVRLERGRVVLDYCKADE